MIQHMTLQAMLSLASNDSKRNILQSDLTLPHRNMRDLCSGRSGLFHKNLLQGRRPFFSLLLKLKRAPTSRPHVEMRARRVKSP